MANETEYAAPVSFNKTWHTEPYPFISPPRPELSAKGKIVVKVIAADLQRRDQVDQAYQSIRNKLDKNDVKVINAVLLPAPGSLTDSKPEDLLRWSTDFLPFAGPEPVDFSTSTCLANIASTPGLAGYTISKAACLKTMDYFAMENPNVRVVSVQQGWVATASNGFQKEAPDKSELPGQFYIWLASPEDKFLKGKFVWANWDAQELLEIVKEVRSTKLLNWIVQGVPTPLNNSFNMIATSKLLTKYNR
ncbi:uncharacterized protein BDW43DRAFT_304481 [Aspergillus alliaceus]|uniref:uncharacterized protein n=1 Tax=Petromyces alliaceus TaxID=209559 RepID=UPI0012A4C4DB|nr:uncharacterized protein BDW43DRAFT_304481 [Aspergillus alliaceus]KAB8227609.1 hypothetical protein BDW43DRAFT_304481 [Aspergillus alliaceus]